MGERNTVGSFEELLLRAILHLGDNAYGVRIRQHVEAAADRVVSIGAVYTTLERMETKGYVASWLGEATPERGGKAKRYYRVEGAGVNALRATEDARRKVGLVPAFGNAAGRGLA